MNMNALLSSVKQMRSHAEGLTADPDRPQLKVSVGPLQFEAAGGPDESVADLRDEFEALYMNLNEQAEDVETDSSEDIQEQIRAELEEREATALDQINRGAY